MHLLPVAYRLPISSGCAAQRNHRVLTTAVVYAKMRTKYTCTADRSVGDRAVPDMTHEHCIVYRARDAVFCWLERCAL